MTDLVDHCRPQNVVETALISFSLALEPFENVGIDAHCQLLFDWSIELPRTAPCQSCTVVAGRSEKSISLSGMAANAANSWYGFRYLAHKFSFPTWWCVRAEMMRMRSAPFSDSLYACATKSRATPPAILTVCYHCSPFSKRSSCVTCNGSSNTSCAASKLTPCLR